ncbi:MAG: DUF2079 domain-containing protein [Oscillospiraceae bacterium]|nr:DUF2079 domain-containing protein [Oscillospiraceae bacterium]
MKKSKSGSKSGNAKNGSPFKYQQNVSEKTGSNKITATIISRAGSKDHLQTKSSINAENPQSVKEETITDETAMNEENKFRAVQKIRKYASQTGTILKNTGLPDLLLIRFMAVYLIFSGFFLLRSVIDKTDPVGGWKDYIAGSSLPLMTGLTAGGFIVLSVLYYLLRKTRYNAADHIALFCGFMLFSCCGVIKNNSFYLATGLIILSLILMYQIFLKTDPERLDHLPNFTAMIIVLVCAVCVAAVLIITSINKYRIFWSATFDFGIFVQMFHSMSRKLLPLTTCERGMVLSHFNVHASFILYLLVPVYKLFPEPETLLFIQPVLVMSGVIPLYLTAVNHKFKGLSLAGVCLIYVFSSSLIMPCMYDFHENCLLPPLLMWAIYAADKRKFPLLYIMSALVCIVKEDAPLYIICLSIYLFFDEKSVRRVHAVILAVLSGIYFAGITGWLNEHGDGQFMAAMRFSNLTIDQAEGFTGIIKNVLEDPLYFFSLLITEKSLLFFIQVFLPLLFIPFISKKAYRLILIFPFVIMNLAVGSSYGYASNINFQYIFGPACFLIYLTVLNCSDMNLKTRNTLVALAAAASVISSVSCLTPSLKLNEVYNNNSQQYERMHECLNSIPEDASVIGFGYYMPHIANRDEVYLFDQANLESPLEEGKEVVIKDVMNYDFFILKNSDEITEPSRKYLEKSGFTIYKEFEDVFVIYINPQYQSVK